MPASFIGAFHLPAAQSNGDRRLLQQFPNLTVIDMTADVPAGAGGDRSGSRRGRVPVSCSRSRPECWCCMQRSRRAATSACAKPDCCARWAHRAGSCRARKLPRCCASVVLPGLLAAVGASAVGWALATYAFEFRVSCSRRGCFLAASSAAAAAALIGGWFGLRGVLGTPPLATLREA